MDIYDKGLITILGLALLFIVVAVPLVLRKVPRNVAYGFRTRATMGSDEVWFAANAHFIASLCGAFVAIGVYLFRPLSPQDFLPVSVLIMVIPSLIATMKTARYVRSIVRSLDKGKNAHYSC